MKFIIAFIFLPIFISINSKYHLSLIRVGNDNSFLITFQLSIIICIYSLYIYALKNIKKIIYIILLILIYYGVTKSTTVLKYSIILTILISLKYFFDQLNKKDLKYDLITPLLITFIIIVNGIFYDKDLIFLNIIRIYDFEQYFSINVLLLSIITLNKKLISITYFICGLYLSYISGNNTGIVISFIIPLVYFLVYYSKNCIKFFLFIFYLIIYLYFTILYFLYPIFLIITSNYQFTFHRFKMINEFYSGLESWIELIIPIHPNISLYGGGFHSDILLVLSIFGIVGLIILNKLTLSRITLALKSNNNSALILIVILSAISVPLLPLFHLSTAVLIVFCISYIDRQLEKV